MALYSQIVRYSIFVFTIRGPELDRVQRNSARSADFQAQPCDENEQTCCLDEYPFLISLRHTRTASPAFLRFLHFSPCVFDRPLLIVFRAEERSTVDVKLLIIFLWPPSRGMTCCFDSISLFDTRFSDHSGQTQRREPYLDFDRSSLPVIIYSS